MDALPRTHHVAKRFPGQPRTRATVRKRLSIPFVTFLCNVLIGLAMQGPAPTHAAAPQPINTAAIEANQDMLMEQMLDGLASQRAGVSDLYFVGFGGYAHQDVFLHEVLTISDMFDARFDTARRSIRLINNPATTRLHPLANLENLSTALHAVGARIDAEEDIVFLFLTSHGRPNWISVNFRPFRLHNLSARALRTILDWSLIKWRVIVVSACYSGSFIDELANDTTLIMTAARHDRTSFGCGHENRFTYFGKAYFDVALRKSFSFTDAFASARKAIQDRENAERLKHSLPQISLGKAIAPKLETLERRLRTRSTGQLAVRPNEPDSTETATE